MEGPIGVFDSGFGGLTVLKAIQNILPDYNYLYLGDNARTPYGPRSFDTVYKYTLQAVKYLFDQGCPLVILACNTASAKALRNIQQLDLQRIAPDKRVLGVIRPTTEVIGNYSKNGRIGILGTKGTIKSNSYAIEIQKFFPDLTVYQQACPMWVPLVENNQLANEGADFFVSDSINQLLVNAPSIDTILLGCTHYPLLLETIQKHIPEGVKVVLQGDIVGASLDSYLKRHPDIESRCLKKRETTYLTTDSAEKFSEMAEIFLGNRVLATTINL